MLPFTQTDLPTRKKDGFLDTLHSEMSIRPLMSYVHVSGSDNRTASSEPPLRVIYRPRSKLGRSRRSVSRITALRLILFMNITTHRKSEA